MHTTVLQQLDAIEAEMRRIEYWQDRPPPPEAFAFREAFATDTMAYSQWLQFVFMPRAREIAAQRGRFPPSSDVAVQAVREFDGDDLAQRLIALLSEFDELIIGGPRPLSPSTLTPRGLPRGLRWRIGLTVAAIASWTLLAMLGAIYFGGLLNQRLPRSLIWYLEAEPTPSGLETRFVVHAGVGSGTDGPLQLERLGVSFFATTAATSRPAGDQSTELTDAIARLKTRQTHRAHSSYELSRTPANATEIRLADVTLDTVTSWIHALIDSLGGPHPQPAIRDSLRAAMAADPALAYATLDRIRSARSRAALLALANSPAVDGLRVVAPKRPLEPGNYLSQPVLGVAGAAAAMLGLIPFWKLLMSLRRESLAARGR